MLQLLLPKIKHNIPAIGFNAESELSLPILTICQVCPQAVH